MVFLRKYSRFTALLCFCAVFLLPGPAFLGAAPSEVVQAGKVWFIPIRGDIEPSIAAFVRREAGRALSQGAGYLVFEIDTFGGRVDTALQITSYITSVKKAKTIAWVNSGEASMGVSWSAGALIAFSCDAIYMAPGTSIGAAAPVTSGPGGASESAGEKAVSAVRSQMAALAERNGYPAGLALAMVDYDVELSEYLVDGQPRVLTVAEYGRLKNTGAEIEVLGEISPQGKLLSLTAGEAVRYGLASGLASDKDGLMEAAGILGELVESSPSAADTIISILNSGAVQSLLILLGLVLIFLEIQSPGFGVPGVIAVIAFLAVFVPSAMLGRVGSLEIILFLTGLGLLAVEIFVLPGFGVVGISGFIVIGLSLVLSMQDFVIPSFEWEWSLFGRNVLVVFAGLIAGITGIAVIALLGPRLPVFNRLVLKTQITGTAGGPDPDSEIGKVQEIPNLADEDEENYAALLGKTGVADSVLRPSGRALIDGKIYSVEAAAEFVEAGRGILVTRIRGNRIIVRRV
jgi:membrane-bound serine protease (ClpP class)